MSALDRERAVALFVVAALAWNYPLLGLFDRAQLVAGIPLLYLYIFCAWLGVIVVMARLATRPHG